MTNIYGVACYSCSSWRPIKYYFSLVFCIFILHMDKHVKVAPYLYFSNSFIGDEI